MIHVPSLLPLKRTNKHMRCNRIFASALQVGSLRLAPAVAREAIKRLAVVRPDLVGEWVPHLNDLDVSTVAITEMQAVTWSCSTCQHQWAASVRERAIGEAGCPECARRAASGITAITNNESISQTHPGVAARWDVVRNGALRPSDVSDMSTRSVWWVSTDGKESFRKPVYAFVREQRSLREVHKTQIAERVKALEDLAPQVGYKLPDTIPWVVSGYSSSPPGAEPFLWKGGPASISEGELNSFEAMWCEEYKQKKNASMPQEVGEIGDGLLVRSEPKKVTPFTLKLDTSLSPLSPYQPALPLLAMLEYHAEQLVTAALDGNAGVNTTLPSYLLEKDQATSLYSLPEATRARLNAHRLAANRLKFKASRPFSSALTTREMPTMPSPDSILESETAGKSSLQETRNQSNTDLAVPFKRRGRSGGFGRNQSLDMPDEIDESPPMTLSAERTSEPAAVPEPLPEVEVPAAPRVVGRRRKS